jgi:hypothetical protein
VKLKARALWRVIDNGDIDPQEDVMALDALCSVVPPELATVIADNDMAKEAWDTIATLRVRDGRVKKNTAQQLRREFELAAFRDSESMEEFALRMKGMAAQLTILEDPITDSTVVEKILRSVPS